MPYLPLRKLLDKYFYAEEIAEILKDVDETPTNNKDADIKLLIQEWPRRGHSYYDLIKKLSTPQIREICSKYGIDSKGKEKELIKRIKKTKLLDLDTKSLQGTNPSLTPSRELHYKIGPVNISRNKLIGIIITSVFFLAAPWWSSFISDNFFTSSQDCVTGEFGLIIQDCNLGIELTRPNLAWISDTEYQSFYIPQDILPDTDANVLGSIIIGKKGSASLSIKVFEIKQLTDQAFENFANKFHKKLKATYPTYDHAEPFIVGDNAIFEMTGETDAGSPNIWKYQIESHNDRIYVFLEALRTDRSNVEETYSELKQLYNSFTYLK